MKRLSGCQEFGPTIGFKSFGDLKQKRQKHRLMFQTTMIRRQFQKLLHHENGQ